MKKIVSVLSFAVLALTLFSFTKPAKNEVFKVDTEHSTISWIGRKVTGQHTGTIKISSGELIFAGKAVKGGSFVMDMKSITSDSERLTGHLKTDDFFSVEKNPTSEFQITKVTSAGADRVNITGNLTIKGITQPLTFPASIKKDGKSVAAVAKGIKVNRAKYDVRYGSKSFFNDIGNKAIDDDFELEVKLLASK